MRRPVLATLAAIGLIFPVSSIAQAPSTSPPITIFVVRHAEKGPEPDDPALTEKGNRRAAELARVLQDARVSTLFATQYKRTQLTLAPLARALGTTTAILDAADVNGLVAKLQALPPGSRAAVASHSNLVHLIVERLSGAKVTELRDTDYDRMYVVTVGGPGIGSTAVLRYGEP